MYLTNELKAKLRQSMAIKGLTQGDVAALLGVSQAAVSKWMSDEQGQIDIKRKYAVKLCDIIGTDYISEEYSQITGKNLTNINTAENGTAIQNNDFSVNHKEYESMGTIYIRLVNSILELFDIPSEDKIKTIQIINKTGVFGDSPGNET